jgi:hypothetical protein
MATAVGMFELLSGSGDATTDGRHVDIAATATPGTLLHTASIGTDYWDIITIELANRDTVQRTVTIEWGGTTAADQLVYTLPAGLGAVVAIDRRRLRDSHVVRAFSDSANKVSAYIEVDRYRAQVT